MHVSSSTGTKHIGATPQKQSKFSTRTGPQDRIKRLSFYEMPPTGDLTIEEFEDLGSRRLRMLKALESKLKTISIEKENTNQFADILDMIPLPPPRSPVNEAEYIKKIRNDVISHYVLILAYRGSEDKWLVNMELKLLKVRLLVSGSKSQFEEDYQEFLECDEAPPTSETEPRYGYLRRVHRETSKLYVVPFQQVIDLVSKRQVYLEGGKAWITDRQREGLLYTAFVKQIEKNLAAAHKHLASHGTDSRISEFVDRLPRQYLGSDFSASEYAEGQIELKDLNQLADKHFPLCMKKIHYHIRHQHHAKHTARLQYGLFLKAIGLTLEQSMEFWHSEFVIRAGEDGWKKKNYEYNIKYNYGMAGKRQNFAPYSCQKILGFSGSVEHGCPFKNLSHSEINASIGRTPMSQEIMSHVKDKAYTEACIAHYKSVWGDSPGSRMLESHALHPNQYYLESRRDAERVLSGEMSAPQEYPSSSSDFVAIHSRDQPANGNDSAKNTATLTQMSKQDEEALNASFASYDDEMDYAALDRMEEDANQLKTKNTENSVSADGIVPDEVENGGTDQRGDEMEM